MSTILLFRRSEVGRYLAAVRAAGDSERNAFGFLPKPAYDEFATQERMIVAADSLTREMVGYILYGGVMPQGKIFQTWTAKEARGQGIGRRLVSEVVRQLERLHYLSLRADVAQDLTEANEFYASLGFETIMVRAAKTRGRNINVRVKELATPSLLELATDRADADVCLPVVLPHGGGAPLYVIDLNVIFDIARARSQATDSGKVFAAGFENDVRLAVTTELVAELKRHKKPASPDPILEFASSLPRLPPPPRQVHQSIVDEIGALIFPYRAAADRLTVRDKSDLTHLATAIVESAAGFITSEKAILRAADHLRQNYGLEVLSPNTFGLTMEAEAVESMPREVRARGSGVRAHVLQDIDYQEAERFLLQQEITESDRRAALASGTGAHPRRRYMVRTDGIVSAIATWDAPRAGAAPRKLQIYVDEASPAASLASDYLVRRAVADVGPVPPAIFELSTKSGQPSLRQAALQNGFFRLRGSRSQTQTLQKVAVARAITANGWSALHGALHVRAGMNLPLDLPPFGQNSETVQISNDKGECVELTLSDLERLLSPLLLVLPGRAAAIFPITARYAEELFSGSAQPSLLAGREAALRSVRGYVSARGTYTTSPEGGLALFYESGTGGGRQAVTAVARVTRKYLMNKESAARALSEKAVMEAEAVESLGRGAQIVVTEFEDLMLLKKPVRLAHLRSLGCVDGANLVTARRVSHEQVVEIVKAGEPHA